jgi:thymidylate synthase (FAD)
MRVELLDCTDDIENRLGAYAQTCRGKQCDLTNRAKNLKTLAVVLRHQHLSVLRFASATILVSGISRACSHQLVRHAHFGFLQESQRSVKSTHENFVYPFDENVPIAQIKTIYQEAQCQYENLLQMGVRKEDARLVLPQGVATSLIMTANLQAWLHFLNLRLHPAAQAEIRAVAQNVRNILHNLAPTIIDALV